MGNTCYLNSILQVLFYCPQFKTQLKKLFEESVAPLIGYIFRYGLISTSTKHYERIKEYVSSEFSGKISSSLLEFNQQTLSTFLQKKSQLLRFIFLIAYLVILFDKIEQTIQSNIDHNRDILKHKTNTNLTIHNNIETQPQFRSNQTTSFPFNSSQSFHRTQDNNLNILENNPIRSDLRRHISYINPDCFLHVLGFVIIKQMNSSLFFIYWFLCFSLRAELN
jgi:uncharacterized UBP type Zn finger protein